MNEEIIIAPREPEHRPMSKKELAEYFGVTPRTITHWLEWLPHTKIGHVIRFDLEQVKKATELRFGKNRLSA